MIKRLSLALALTVLSVAAYAAPPANISQTVGVCDPVYPQRCIKPDTNGAIPVTGSFTPSGTADVNLKQVGGTTVTTGAGTGAAGTQRVTTSTDSTIATITNPVTVTDGAGSLNVIVDSGTLTAVTTVTNPVGIKGADGSAILSSSNPAPVTGTGSAGTAATGVVTVQGIASATPIVVNQTQVNGVTVSTGAGATGTGSQRVGVAQDTTTIAGSAPGTAGSASTNVLTVQGVASMTPVLVSGTGTAGSAATGVVTIQGIASGTTVPVTGTITAVTTVGTITNPVGIKGADGSGIASNANPVPISDAGGSVTVDGAVTVSSATAPVSTMNSASANSGVTTPIAGVFDDAAPTAITENSFGFVRMSTNRNLYGTIRDAAGNERGANVDANNNLNVGQATAANLNATVVGTGTFATQAAPTAATTGGASIVSNIVPNNTTSVAIKASAGTLYGVKVFSISATIAYFKVYNATQGSTTCGSGTPIQRFVIPASTSGAGAVMDYTVGVAYGTALTYCVVTGIADNDNTAPAANVYIVEAAYK